MDTELTLNLQIDQSSESLKRLCDGLVAAVKPDGGYAAATTDDLAPGTCGDQMVQVEWWIPQHGCDSLENTLDAIKGRLLVAVRDWFATALVPAAAPAPAEGEVAELVEWLNNHAAHLRTMEGIGALPETELQERLDRAATLLQQQAAELATLQSALCGCGVAPVAVSERLPGPGDCDAEGRCWWFCFECPGEHSYWILAKEVYCNPTYWLPAYTIPLPAPQAGEVV